MGGKVKTDGWFEWQVRKIESNKRGKNATAPAKKYSRTELGERIPLYKDDYSLYAAENIIVQNESMLSVPFIFRRAQARLWKLEQECLQKGKPFWIEVLKIRQHGCSLYFSNRALWKTAFTPNAKALIIAHDDGSTGNIFNMLKFSWKNLPDLMKPQTKNDNRDIIYFANPDPKKSAEEGLESRIHVATAGNVHAGASFTVQHVHISEFGRFDEVTDTKKLMGSLMQSIPYLPSTSIVIESTAHGEGNFKKRWDSDNGFLKEFISYVAVEKYREEVDKHFSLSPFEDSPYGNEEEIAELIEKEIHKWYPEWDPEKNKSEIEHEIYCRLAWRRTTIKTKCDGDIKLFDQEYPITPERAFMLSGNSVYPNDKMTMIVKGLQQKIEDKTLQVDRYKFDPDSSSYTGQNWDIDLMLEKNDYGPVYIYEKPLIGFNYVMGIDPSEGLIDGDAAAIVILRIPELIEVATWSQRMDPDLIGDLAFVLGNVYNKALIGVERQYGDAVISRLRRDLKYPISRLYRDKSFEKVKIDNSPIIGWHSNEKTNSERRSFARGLIRDDAITFNHLPTALEHLRCKVFKQEGKKAQYLYINEHGDKMSPNLTVAMGIALQMAKIFPNYITVQERPILKNSLKDWERRIAEATKFDGMPVEGVNLW